MPENLIALSALADGACVCVKKLLLPAPYRLRLSELGLIPGTSVRRLFSAPAGSPIAFTFRGSVLALRRADAERILGRRLP